MFHYKTSRYVKSVDLVKKCACAKAPTCKNVKKYGHVVLNNK